MLTVDHSQYNLTQLPRSSPNSQGLCMFSKSSAAVSWSSRRYSDGHGIRVPLGMERVATSSRWPTNAGTKSGSSARRSGTRRAAQKSPVAILGTLILNISCSIFSWPWTFAMSGMVMFGRSFPARALALSNSSWQAGESTWSTTSSVGPNACSEKLGDLGPE